MTEQEKKARQEIRNLSMFDSIYIDQQFAGERRMLEMLGALNRTIESMHTFVYLYDGSELEHQHTDYTLSEVESLLSELEVMREDLFSNSVNWNRICELGFDHVDRIEALEKNYQKPIDNSEKKV